MRERIDWERVRSMLWELFKPALVAMIVALLVAMGYRGTITNGGMANGQGHAGDLVDAAGVTHLSGLTVTGDLRAGGWLGLSAAAAISCTNGGVITPTATFQPLTSAGAVTPTLATGGIIAGSRLVLENTSNSTIHLADTGTAVLTGAAALGQYDVLELVYDGTRWVEVGRADN